MSQASERSAVCICACKRGMISVKIESAALVLRFALYFFIFDVELACDFTELVTTRLASDRFVAYFRAVSPGLPSIRNYFYIACEIFETGRATPVANQAQGHGRTRKEKRNGAKNRSEQALEGTEMAAGYTPPEHSQNFTITTQALRSRLLTSTHNDIQNRKQTTNWEQNCNNAGRTLFTREMLRPRLSQSSCGSAGSSPLASRDLQSQSGDKNGSKHNRGSAPLGLLCPPEISSSRRELPRWIRTFYCRCLAKPASRKGWLKTVTWHCDILPSGSRKSCFSFRDDSFRPQRRIRTICCRQNYDYVVFFRTVS